ncbi:sugar kinase [Rhizobium rhizoryzae]|uniref:Sulfofructose kinase n=1 Tax=Rhizobium rhizoryzae TaxID=451876 RepID=A0A7W6PT00_9HYPH|nr:sugar kinase [Rhizobium rhizoryzae]MBB4145514.1 sulfofructose kinase [Rhizobium rhizoryzae]
MSKRILCVGAAVLDTIFRVRALPSGEGKILPYEMVQVAEGMASSAAYAIVRLGGSATLLGAVGDDDTGRRICDDLAQAGIDTTAMTVVAGAPSALSTILVDDRGDRLIVPFYDPRLHHTIPQISDEMIAGFDAVLVDVRWARLAREVLQAARRVGIPAILDGDVAPVETLLLLAEVADHIIFSEPAARSLAQAKAETDLVRELAERFPQALVCVTLGAAGAYWMEGAELRHQPALQVVAVDTLAAGDAFHGAYALAVAEGLDTSDAVRLGSVTAALKCTVFGGRTGMPLRDDAEKALQQLPSPSKLRPH